LLKIRFALDQYINLRPVKLYPGVECPLKDKGPEQIDYVVVRENTEGLYAGSGGCLRQGTRHEIAVQESVNTYMGVERCLRYAFELAATRPRKKLTLCGKTNVLTFAFGLWERVFHELAKDFPQVELDYAHVDATCMWMVKNPEWFDVIVTDNMFGDIITDLGAITQGGLGIAAGGNINPRGRVHVRAHRRLGPEVHRPGQGQPFGRDSGRADDARGTQGRSGRGRRGAGRDLHSAVHGQPGRRTDGHDHGRGRGPCGRGVA
jgi:isocitrate/isopropylmalate dehydrogenase